MPPAVSAEPLLAAAVYNVLSFSSPCLCNTRHTSLRSGVFDCKCNGMRCLLHILNEEFVVGYICSGRLTRPDAGGALITDDNGRGFCYTIRKYLSARNSADDRCKRVWTVRGTLKLILHFSWTTWNGNEVISIEECCVVGGTENLCNDKGNGVIGLNDMVVGAVNAYFSGNVNTAKALNGCCIEAVVNFAQLGGHHTLATGQEHRYLYRRRQRVVVVAVSMQVEGQWWWWPHRRRRWCRSSSSSRW